MAFDTGCSLKERPLVLVRQLAHGGRRTIEATARAQLPLPQHAAARRDVPLRAHGSHPCQLLRVTHKRQRMLEELALGKEGVGGCAGRGLVGVGLLHQPRVQLARQCRARSSLNQVPLGHLLLTLNQPWQESLEAGKARGEHVVQHLGVDAVGPAHRAPHGRHDRPRE